MLKFFYYSGETYLMFVADAADIVHGEFFVVWRNFRCGYVSDVEKLDIKLMFILFNFRSF